jgi:mRNA interferase MazF
MTIKGKEDVNMDINTFDILLVDFGEVEFCGEQAGVRPAIVIQNALGNRFSDTTIVMPFTTRIKNIDQSTHSLFMRGTGGLTQSSMLLGECVRQVSKQRIIKRIGSVNDRATRLEVKRVYESNFGEV